MFVYSLCCKGDKEATRRGGKKIPAVSHSFSVALDPCQIIQLAIEVFTHGTRGHANLSSKRRCLHKKSALPTRWLPSLWRHLKTLFIDISSSHTRLDVHLDGYRHQVWPVRWINSKERYRGSGVPHFSTRAIFHNIRHGWQVIQQRIPQDKYHSAGYRLCIGSKVKSQTERVMHK